MAHYCAVVNSWVEGSIASKWAQMPVVEKAFEGARLNPTKTTYVREACVFSVPPFQHQRQ